MGIVALHGDLAIIPADVHQGDVERLLGQKRFDILRPFDKADAVAFDIFVEAEFDILIFEPISIDVIQRQTALEIAFHDVEGRGNDIVFDLQGGCDSTRQSGLASAKVALQKHHVPRFEKGGDQSPKLAGLFFRFRNECIFHKSRLFLRAGRNYKSSYGKILVSMEKVTVLVVGGGPVGLYCAGRLEGKGISYHLFEAEDSLGGQPSSLYPAKEVVDVPLFTPRNAAQIVAGLQKRVNPKNISLSTVVLAIKETPSGVILTTTQGDYEGEYVILATGLGFHKPRPLGIPYEEKCSNILYALLNPETLRNQRIAIFGGGDSALDWAKQLSKISPFVSLVHRRTEFRGDPKTIEGCKLALYLPYVPDHLEEKDGRCQTIFIKNVNDGTLLPLPVDVVLVNYGQIPSPSTFGYKLSPVGFGIEVQSGYHASPRVFAVGDCAYLPDKKKRITPGMEEVDAVIASLPLCK